MGVGGRKLDAPAKTKVGVGSRPLGSQRPGLDVDRRVLAIITKSRDRTPTYRDFV